MRTLAILLAIVAGLVIVRPVVCSLWGAIERAGETLKMK